MVNTQRFLWGSGGRAEAERERRGERGFFGRTLLLRLQGYQTCAGAGMLAPGVANAVLVQHFVLGVFAHLLGDFGSLLQKHLFFGRTLLLRLQTCVGAGMLVPGLANAVVVQHFVLGVFPAPFKTFR